MQKQILKRVIKALRPYYVFVIFSLICAVITVILTLEIPVLTGRAVDCIVGKNNVDIERLMTILKQMILMILCTSISQFVMSRCNNHVTYHVTYDFRQQAFDKMMRLPIEHIDSHSHGDYMSRIVTDADVFADGLLLGFTQLFTGVMTIFGTIVFMVRINSWIALFVVAVTPLSLFVAKFIATRTYDMFHLQAKHRGDQTAYVSEMVGQKRLIRAFADEKRVKNEFDAYNEALTKSSLKAVFYSSLTNPGTRFVNSLVYATVGVAGAIFAIQGRLTVGALTSFLGYASSYTKPFNEISGVITELQNAIACAERIFEMIDMEEEKETGKEIIEQCKGEIVFEHVSFSYDKSRPLIEDLSLEVKPGEKIAIVGPTGSGKTTLINLLMRFYDVDGGRILIDGTDIKELTRENLRQQFGMVLQETWLKSATILENLMLAKNATMEEVLAATKASHAHEFIRQLPQGYDTVIHADGGISQGQRQLLCIARVMLHLPPMLILDEATSSIDTNTEMKIQKAFATMMKGRTTFVVAHRLSTIKEADKILYMQDGKVLEMGNHETLLAKDGYYAKLYYSQFAES